MSMPPPWPRPGLEGAARRKPAAATDMSWTSRNKANGSAAVSVKQPLSPFWDARIGADMTVVSQPQTLTSAELLSEKISGDGGSRRNPPAPHGRRSPLPASARSGTRPRSRPGVDPGAGAEQARHLLSKSLPLGEQYSLTLQNGYNVIQQGIVPVPGIAATRRGITKPSSRPG